MADKDQPPAMEDQDTRPDLLPSTLVYYTVTRNTPETDFWSLFVDISPNDDFDLNTLSDESFKSHAEVVYDDKNNQILDMMQPSVVEDTRPNWLPSAWVYYNVNRSNPETKTLIWSC
ncbi:hypothetical protein ACFXTO_006421 [Malus domestica]